MLSAFYGPPHKLLDHKRSLRVAVQSRIPFTWLWSLCSDPIKNKLTLSFSHRDEFWREEPFIASRTYGVSYDLGDKWPRIDTNQRLIISIYSEPKCLLKRTGNWEHLLTLCQCCKFDETSGKMGCVWIFNDGSSIRVVSSHFQLSMIYERNNTRYSMCGLPVSLIRSKNKWFQLYKSPIFIRSLQHCCSRILELKCLLLVLCGLSVSSCWAELKYDKILAVGGRGYDFSKFRKTESPVFFPLQIVYIYPLAWKL